MHPNQLEAVFALESKNRYEYLIKKVADAEEVYVILDQEECYVTCGSEKEVIIPVWPEREFAEELIQGEWKDCQVHHLHLDDFADLLDELTEENYLVAGFPNRELNASVVSPEDMIVHLHEELKNYE